MKAIHFEEANRIFKLAGCSDLSVQADEEQLLSCWRMSWRERFAALFYGTVWLGIRGQRQPPVWLTCEKDVHVNE